MDSKVKVAETFDDGWPSSKIRLVLLTYSDSGTWHINQVAVAVDVDVNVYQAQSMMAGLALAAVNNTDTITAVVS